jgi:hypothetical protein
MALDFRLSRVRTGVAVMGQDCNYQLDTTKLGAKKVKKEIYTHYIYIYERERERERERSSHGCQYLHIALSMNLREVTFIFQLQIDALCY